MGSKKRLLNLTLAYKKINYLSFGLLLFTYLISCIPGDPDFFIRAYQDRILFNKNNNLQDSIIINLEQPSLSLTLRGLLQASTTTCGENASLYLRIKCDQDITSDSIKYKTTNIAVTYKGLSLPLKNTDTLSINKTKNIISYEFASFYTIDTCKTESITRYSFDSLNPKIQINIDNFIYLNGQRIHIDSIYAFR